MKTRPLFLFFAVLVSASLFICNLPAQSLVTIETVFVGDAGNAADTWDRGVAFGRGGVAYEFSIGKYEVTISQYTTFLNSVASSDPYGLYNPSMGSNLNVAGILRNGSEGAYSYEVVSGSANRPMAFVSWFDAARFANWIHNGATNGASTEVGAYALNGATNGVAPAKSASATWWIPTENEWYKAAYYKGGGTNAGFWQYTTRSDLPPDNLIGAATNQANFRNMTRGDVYSVTQSATYSSGQNYLTDVGAFSNSASTYGTYDQGGNLWELNDLDGQAGSSRGLRGGSWKLNATSLRSSYDSFGAGTTSEIDSIGFRVASVPEPSTYALLLVAGAGALGWARTRR